MVLDVLCSFNGSSVVAASSCKVGIYTVKYTWRHSIQIPMELGNCPSFFLRAPENPNQPNALTTALLKEERTKT